jgi:hypothetical protein
MASDNHYHYQDLRAHLLQIGDHASVAMLDGYSAKVDRALSERSKAAEDLLRENLPKIKHLLRPCHARKGDALTVYTSAVIW